METKIEVGQDWTDGIVVVRVLEVQSDGEVGYRRADKLIDTTPGSPTFGQPLGAASFCQGSVFRATRTPVAQGGGAPFQR